MATFRLPPTLRPHPDVGNQEVAFRDGPGTSFPLGGAGRPARRGLARADGGVAAVGLVRGGSTGRRTRERRGAVPIPGWLGTPRGGRRVRSSAPLELPLARPPGARHA